MSHPSQSHHALQGRPSPVNSPTKPGLKSQDDKAPKSSDSTHSTNSSIHQPQHSPWQDTVEPTPSSLEAPHQKLNGVVHHSSGDDLPKASRALADHPLLGPSVYGASSGGGSGRADTSSSEPTEIPVPETPKRGKTRVKRIRFEQPDANGFYSDHVPNRAEPPVLATQ